MPQPKKVSIPHYRGDSFTALLRVWDDDARTVATDLSAATLTAQIRATTEAPEVLADFDIAVTGNEILLSLGPDVTATLPASCTFDVQADWNSDGTDITTLLAATFAVAPDVTRVSP